MRPAWTRSVILQQEPLVTYLPGVRIADWSADPSDVAAGRLVTPSPRLLILPS